jgi:hypothetical protein
LVHKVLKERQVFKESRELLGLKEPLELKVFKVLPVLRDLKGHKVSLALLGRQESRGLLVRLVHKELRVQ